MAPAPNLDASRMSKSRGIVSTTAGCGRCAGELRKEPNLAKVDCLARDETNKQQLLTLTPISRHKTSGGFSISVSRVIPLEGQPIEPVSAIVHSC